MTPQELAEVVNYQAFLERTGADHELAQELIVLLMRDMPSMMAGIADGVQQRDAKALERAAHALKGAVANFSARPAMLAAESLERMGRGNDLSSATAALETLRHEVTRLEEALNQVAKVPP